MAGDVADARRGPLPVLDQLAAMQACATDWTPTQLPPAPGATVCVSGVARSAAPGGQVSAPLSGTPCVWYQAVDKDNYLKDQVSGGMRLPRAAFQPPAYVPGTLFPVAPGVAKSRLMPVKLVAPDIQRSTSPIELEIGSGTVVVQPQRDSLVDCKKVSVNYLTHDERGNDKDLYQEWVIEAGEHLRCYGAIQMVGSTPTLVPDANGLLFVTTGDEQRVRSLVAGRGYVIATKRAVIRAVLLVVLVLLVLGGLLVWSQIAFSH